MITFSSSLRGIKLLWKEIRGISIFEDCGKRILVEQVVAMAVFPWEKEE